MELLKFPSWGWGGRSKPSFAVATALRSSLSILDLALTPSLVPGDLLKDFKGEISDQIAHLPFTFFNIEDTIIQNMDVNGN